MRHDPNDLKGLRRWVRLPYLEDQPRQLSPVEQRMYRGETVVQAARWLADLLAGMCLSRLPDWTSAAISSWMRNEVEVAVGTDAHRCAGDRVVDLMLVHRPDEPPASCAAFEASAVALAQGTPPARVFTFERRTRALSVVAVDAALLARGAELLERAGQALLRRLNGEGFHVALATPCRQCRFCPVRDRCGPGAAWHDEMRTHLGPLELLPAGTSRSDQEGAE
jgi:hypothetical protein